MAEINPIPLEQPVIKIVRKFYLRNIHLLSSQHSAIIIAHLE